MTNPLAQDLGGVVRLLEKATPGPWSYSKRNDPESPASIVSGMDSGMAYAVAMCPRYRGNDWHQDADAIIAAVNFLRAHSAEIAGALRDAERFAWWFGEMDDSSAQLIGMHIKPINGKQPSLDEWRAAIDCAMKQGGGGGE